MNIRRASMSLARATREVGFARSDRKYCGSSALAFIVSAANRIERRAVSSALIMEALEERDETARAERAELAALRAAWCPARPRSESWCEWEREEYAREWRAWRAECNDNLPTGDAYNPRDVTEADREGLVIEYYELHKAKRNFRARWIDFDALALEELVSMLNILHREPYTL